MIQSPASWPHGRLSKLKKLRVNYDEDACMASLARVSASFHLPSLLIFEAERIIDEDLYHLQGWTCPMGSSPITTINLLDCAFSLPGLWNFIRSCKRLTSFTSAFAEYFGVSTYSPGDLFEGLTPYELCLKHLVVASVMFTPETRSERCFWHSFHDFAALKSLEVEEYYLTGNDQVRDYPDYLIESKLLDILPSSLETLTIIHCNLWSIPKLLETADTHDYPLLRLKTNH